MYLLLEDELEKRAAQNVLGTTLKRSLNSVGKRKIGFPGGNQTLPMFSNGNGELWYSFQDVKTGKTTPRYWNAFGFLDQELNNQLIAVEINIPSKTSEPAVAGFFVKKIEDDSIFLMHSGRIGGGGKGIGKSAFLAWSKYKEETVFDASGQERSGVVICDIYDPNLVDRIFRFADRVNNFKLEMKRGLARQSSFQDDLAEFEKFSEEFSGRKRGRRKSTRIDYESYHGDIVSALYKHYNNNCQTDEQVFSNKQIDLYIKSSGDMVAVFEVKTSISRQAIYTAVGQLMMHSIGRQDIQRILVIPEEEELFKSARETFTALGIRVQYFEREKDGKILLSKFVR